MEKIPNRFELVVLASKRAKRLFKGAKSLLETDNLEIVTAFREIAEGKVPRANSEGEIGARSTAEKVFIAPQTGDSTS